MSTELEYERRIKQLEEQMAAKSVDAVLKPKITTNPYNVPDEQMTHRNHQPWEVLQSPDMVRSANATISRDQIGSFLSRITAETLSQTNADIKRAGITTSTGFTPYVLETPSIRIYPTECPFSQMIPRVVGLGTDIEHWKSVLSIFYYGGINSGPFGQPGLGGTTDGGTTINNFVYNVQSYSATYQTIFQPQTQSFQSQWRSRALEGDLMARAKLDTLYALKLQEENWLINGCSTLHRPAKPLLSVAATGGHLSGSPTTYWVQITALSGSGLETTPSAAASISVPSGTTGLLSVTFQGQVFATGYVVYVGTGATQPANGSMLGLIAGNFTPSGLPAQNSDYIGNMSITMQVDNLTSSTGNPPATNGATVGTNLFPGAIALCYANPNALTAPSVGEQGMTSVIMSPAASSGALALTDMYALFRKMYGQARANPSHLFVSPVEGETLAQLIGNASNFRIATSPTQGNVDKLAFGVSVGSILNPVTQRYVEVVTLPFLAQGTIMAASFSVPFPLPSGVQDPPFRVMVNQDYTMIEYPPSIANPQQYGWAYLTDEVLVNQYQGGFGLLEGIVPPTQY